MKQSSKEYLPRVFVMMATYNGERFLGEQIDSILAQQGLSVTLRKCDDVSTDGTFQIASEYQKGLFLGSYELYKPTCRVRTYEWFCKKGSFAVAYWYWCLIELLKKSICKKRLFDYE